ncbi:MAG: hypothetical protein Q8Q09_23690 [Deltaproteobacteria bacterium]|nr:hypothetical protein [Deltaproteobacteria bacterium]
MPESWLAGFVVATGAARAFAFAGAGVFLAETDTAPRGLAGPLSLVTGLGFELFEVCSDSRFMVERAV